MGGTERLFLGAVWQQLPDRRLLAGQACSEHCLQAAAEGAHHRGRMYSLRREHQQATDRLVHLQYSANTQSDHPGCRCQHITSRGLSQVYQALHMHMSGRPHARLVLQCNPGPGRFAFMGCRGGPLWQRITYTCTSTHPLVSSPAPLQPPAPADPSTCPPSGTVVPETAQGRPTSGSVVTEDAQGRQRRQELPTLGPGQRRPVWGL